VTRPIASLVYQPPPAGRRQISGARLHLKADELGAGQIDQRRNVVEAAGTLPVVALCYSNRFSRRSTRQQDSAASPCSGSAERAAR